MNKPYILGIAGGTGSGKTTLAQALIHHLGPAHAVLISHDAYYKNLSHLSVSERVQTNFDHPDALETTLLIQHLEALKKGESIPMPAYDFHTHTRKLETVVISPRPIVIVEGILVFSHADLCSQFDLRIFVDTAPDVRLSRRFLRDITQRGRTPESVDHQYLTTVRPMHDAFVEPSRKYAHLIIPGENDNRTAIALILGHLQTIL